MINDVTEDDIINLNDEELRELVGKLCEDTLNEHGIETTCVIYGGNQNESDGGVDVRVSSKREFNDDWPVPRNNTIFQVKKPSMPPNEIKKEMKDSNDNLKDSIKELIELNGAYIIVSSGDSVSDSRLKKRIEAMQEELASIDKNCKVKLDFYDRKRIANWTKKYPATAIWVNEKLGKRTLGWKSYSNWSDSTEEEKEYIIDKNRFLHRENFNKENEILIIDGLNEIRRILKEERKVVRLAGLSGVGKTRFAQALFDNSIGEEALDKENVIYCDISDSPNPVPKSFIQELVTMQKKAIVIIDNCDIILHEELTKYVIDVNSKISLLTIEYDVKESSDNDSFNYYLDTSSDDAIRSILRRDFDYIDESNIETIVNCSDGNYRIAIYLAKTIDKNSSIGILDSENLFKRLFYQNNQEDKNLLDVGEICSLFISFDKSYSLDDSINEIKVLTSIAEKTPKEILSSISELEKRQLIQKRGNMRALLPHAIANKLADDFLSGIPHELFLSEIKKIKRLELSFFRRLKFLHDKEYSINISKEYMNYFDFKKLDSNKIELLECIKTIVPEEILSKIEKVTDVYFFDKNMNEFSYNLARILSYIAYDEKLFSRAVKIIIKFAETEEPKNNYNSIRLILSNLFVLVYSGTHATVDNKLEIIDGLLKDENTNKQSIGIGLLENILDSHYHIIMNTDFSSSSKRDYGYVPKTEAEYKECFLKIFNYIEKSINNNVQKEKLKEIIVNKFVGLVILGLFDDIVGLINKIIAKEKMSGLWNEIKSLRHYKSKKMSKGQLIELKLLEKKCEPKTIEEKIECYLSKNRAWYISDEKEQSILNNNIYNLGKDIARKENNKYIKEINNQNALWCIPTLVKGMYDVLGNNQEIIYYLLDNISNDNDKVYKSIISSYISNIDDKSIRESALNEILNNENYKKFYPEIQLMNKLYYEDVERLIISLKDAEIPINNYYDLAYSITDLPIEDILRIIKNIPKGKVAENIIIEVLYQIYIKGIIDNDLDEYSRNFIAELDYSGRDEINDTHNFEIGEIAKRIYNKNNGKKYVITIFNKIKDEIENGFSFYSNYSMILDNLIKIFPLEFIEVITSVNEENLYKIPYFINNIGVGKDPFELIDDDTIINWMEENNKVEIISKIINPIHENDGKFYWKKISIYILENYYDKDSIVNNLFYGIYPHSWSGEYSKILETRLNLAKELKMHSDKNINELGNKLNEKIEKEIKIRKEEEKKEQEKYNTFE